PGGRIPVDSAHVVAGLPLPHLGDLGAEPDRGGAVLACAQPLDPAPDLEVERPQQRLGERARPRPVRGPLSQWNRGGHAARSTTSISGTGTASRTASTIAAASTSAASAS